MEKTTTKMCKSCKYHMYTSVGIACDYLNQTGKMRDCNIGECDKYEKKRKKGKVATR